MANALSAGFVRREALNAFAVTHPDRLQAEESL